MTRGKRSFGEVEKLPSGRYRARYTGPDGIRHKAPNTFAAKVDADAWLSLRRSEILRHEWEQPKDDGPTFGEYSRQWLAERPLKPRTREHYVDLLDRHIGPTFDELALRRITPEVVARWHAKAAPGKPTMRAHAYSLARTIMSDAVRADLLAANPCRIRGAGQAKRASKTRPANLNELATIVEAMPERLRMMVLLAAWCGLRFGELTALRRRDVATDGSVIHVRRGVVRVRGQLIEDTPKTAAGIRDVAVPPHLQPALLAHLVGHAQAGRDGLLFPAVEGTHLPVVSLYAAYYPARQAAGRTDLRFHDLRHTGAVLAAQAGATLAELMARLGHSTPAAAMRYQHAAAGRDAIVAAKLSELASQA